MKYKPVVTNRLNELNFVISRSPDKVQFKTLIWRMNGEPISIMECAKYLNLKAYLMFMFLNQGVIFTYTQDNKAIHIISIINYKYIIIN